MDEKERMELAYFRQGVINPLIINSDEQTLKERIQEQADKLWTLPGAKGVRRFSWGTIESWLYDYNRGGLDALMDQPRKDTGSYRCISENLREQIDKIIEKHPSLKNTNIIQKLRKEFIDNGKPGNSTLYRYLRYKRPKLRATTQERRSFEAPYTGYLWQTDIMYGPKLPQKGDDGRYRKVQTYLIAIIDDHSRLLCHGQFYFEQNLASYIDTLKTACQKRGIPEKLYCDNGKVFISKQTRRIAAQVGIIVLHAGVRDAAAKGKIERLFKNIQESFLNSLLELNPPKTIDELNCEFWRWMEQDYNNKEHSAILSTPIFRYLQTAHKMRLLPRNEEQDKLFLFEEERTVKKDGTFSLGNRRFETDWFLAGEKITVRYEPGNSTRPFVYYQKICYGIANLLDRQANCNLPRHKPKDKGNKK